MSEVRVKRHERVIAGKHSAKIADYSHAIGDGALPTFEALGWAFRDVVARRRLKRLLKRAGDPVPLAKAPEGIVRVEGRVETLEPVAGRDDVPCAAFVRRVTEDGPCGCKPDCAATLRVVETRQAAGRFLVRDETGVAIVAGPRMRLLDYHGRELDPMESGALVVRDEDSVTIIGTVRHEAGDDPRARRTDGYRGTKLVPVFHGDADLPVHVFCAPTSGG